MAAGDPTADNPFLALAARHAPWLADAVALCSIGSLFSCALAVHNATARVLFAMGRDGVLPVRARTHPSTAALASRGNPHIVWNHRGDRSAARRLARTGPDRAYGFTGTIGALAVILVWMLGGLALMCFSARTAPRRLVRGLVLPALSVVVLAYPVWAVVTSGDAPDQSYRSVWAPLAVLAWLVLGIAAYTWLRRRRPEALHAIGATLAHSNAQTSPTGIPT